jgi:type I site-specific restriction endonuclease
VPERVEKLRLETARVRRVSIGQDAAVTEQLAYLTPEARARVEIDRMLASAGWAVQDAARANLSAARGVAVREFVLKAPHGRADYLLFVDGTAAGVVEAKKEGQTLTGVEWQSAKYIDGLPDEIPTALEGALPFAYESTGAETRFTNTLDPDAASRPVFSFHRPETFAAWLEEVRRHPTGPTLRHRLRTLPPLTESGLWPAQFRAITNLERSLAAGRPRALIQMATGSGKTFTAANVSYRLVKHADARRILFLVDRANYNRYARVPSSRSTSIRKSPRLECRGGRGAAGRGSRRAGEDRHRSCSPESPRGERPSSNRRDGRVRRLHGRVRPSPTTRCVRRSSPTWVPTASG